MAASRRLTQLADRLAALADFPDGPLVVALSGGADSAALAWLAVRTGLRVRAVHVNHRLPASPILERAARSIADRLGIDLQVEEVDVGEGPSFEAQARRVRYRAFLGALTEGEWLCTGHTRDDQAETVLAHLLRGSGLDGLAGIPRRRPPFARPLLSVARRHTRELATLAGLGWRDDPTNRDLQHLRNRIRTRLLPQLESEYGPGVVEGLIRTAEVAAGEAEFLDRAADRLRIELSEGKVRLVAGELRVVHPAVAARAVRRAWTRIRPPHPPSRETVEAILAVAEGRRGPADLPEGVTARRDGPWLELVGAPPEEPPAPVDLAVPGVTAWGRWRFETVVHPEPRPVPLSPYGMVAPHRRDLRLVVRAARPGDRIRIPGGSKRVTDALAEARIPAHRRTGWPVVAAEGEVVWIPGVRRGGWPTGAEYGYFSAVAREESEWETFAP